MPNNFERWQWAFPVMATLHNLEEAIWLPSWVAKHSDELPWQINANHFRLGLAAVTVAAYVVTWLSLRGGRRSVWMNLFISYTFVMLLNVFVPHVPASLLFRGYTPGVVTAVALNLPVTTVLLARVWREKIIPNTLVFALVFGVPLGFAGLAAVWFEVKMGRRS